MPTIVCSVSCSTISHKIPPEDARRRQSATVLHTFELRNAQLGNQPGAERTVFELAELIIKQLTVKLHQIF